MPWCYPVCNIHRKEPITSYESGVSRAGQKPAPAGFRLPLAGLGRREGVVIGVTPAWLLYCRHNDRRRLCGWVENGNPTPIYFVSLCGVAPTWAYSPLATASLFALERESGLRGLFLDGTARVWLCVAEKLRRSLAGLAEMSQAVNSGPGNVSVITPYYEGHWEHQLVRTGVSCLPVPRFRR